MPEEEARKAVDELGMWVFIGSEALFFGGMFLGYFVYRYWYPDAFAVAGRASEWPLGLANTLILITSSFFMARAVAAARRELKVAALGNLALVAALGCIFLMIKAYEYHEKFKHGLYPGGVFLPGQTPPQGMSIFFSFYFVMTGIHAVHLMVGLLLVGWIAWRTARAGRAGGGQMTDCALRLEIIGLYWHFVDVIWIFLFPLFYLVGRHS